MVVAPGDDLWALAAGRLAATRGIAPADVADAEIAPYWVACANGTGLPRVG